MAQLKDTVVQGSLRITDTTYTNNLNISSNQAATSTTTGALQILGGLSTGAASYLTGSVHIVGAAGDSPLLVRGIAGCGTDGNRDTSTTSGQSLYLNVNGGPVYVGKTDATSTNQLIVAYTTASTSTSTGALIVSGGTGISGKLYVGSDTNIAGDLYLSANKDMYMLYNNTNYPILENFNNQNIGFSAASGGLYIGYKNTTSMHLYYSTSAADRTEFFTINNNGAYAQTRFGVNGQNTSNTFYVNGNSYFNGNTTTSGNVIAYAADAFVCSISGSPWPFIRFDTRAGGTTYVTTAQNNWGELYCQVPAKKDSTYYSTRFFFRQYSKTANTTNKLSYYEDYLLPVTTDGKTDNSSYNILTTKNTVTMAQGGTGSSSYTANRLLYTTASKFMTSDAAQFNGTDLTLTGNVSGAGTNLLGTWEAPFYQINLGGPTTANVAADSTNPQITFYEISNGNNHQPVHLIYSDYDDYRTPAGLKILGDGDTASSSPAWLEVEGNIYSSNVVATSFIGQNVTYSQTLRINSANYSASGATTNGGDADYKKMIAYLAINTGNSDVLVGRLQPNSQGPFIANIYDRGDRNSENLPKYSTFIYSNLGGRLQTMGTSNYVFYRYQYWLMGDSITGAVWNDYAEFRTSECKEFGYVVMETGKDTLIKTTERLSHFAGVTSDTWGFSQGETETAKTPLAVAGRVLVYTYKDRNEYKPGDCVCAAPDGTVDIMTRDEIVQFPDRIVGTVSCVPDYEEWGGGKNADRDPVKVNGRIWIKVR